MRYSYLSSSSFECYLRYILDYDLSSLHTEWSGLDLLPLILMIPIMDTILGTKLSLIQC